MIDRSDKEFGPREVSAGILVGYSLMGLVNMMITGKAWNEAFLDVKLLTGAVGIAGFLFIYLRQKQKTTTKNE